MAMKKQPDGISRKARGDDKFDESGKKLPPTEWDILLKKDVIGQTIREPQRKWRAVSSKPGAPFPELFPNWSDAITWLLDTWNAVDIGIGAFIEVLDDGKGEQPKEPEGTPEGESQPGPQEPDAGSESTSQPGPPPESQQDSPFAPKVNELTKAEEGDNLGSPPGTVGGALPPPELVGEVVQVSDSDAGVAGESDPPFPASDAETPASAASSPSSAPAAFFSDEPGSEELLDALDDPFAPDFDPFA